MFGKIIIGVSVIKIGVSKYVVQLQLLLNETRKLKKRFSVID